MKRTKSMYLALVTVLFSPMAANAVPITIGSLSSNDDGSTDIITDTLNHREWLRFDVTAAPLTYAEVLAMTASGGAYEGFQVADLADSTAFLNALLGGSNLCLDEGMHINDNDYVYVDCGTAGPGVFLSLFGDNHPTYHSVTRTVLVNFLSNNGVTGVTEVGHILASNAQTASSGIQRRNSVWYNIDGADYGSRTRAGMRANMNSSWLMYRDLEPVTAVPEPGTLALFGLGLAAISITRRRRKV